jgi:biotin synthase
MAILRALRDLGYEVGSGVMVGIPGQTHEDLAGDIAAFVELDLDMIGVGPYVPHAGTPLAGAPPAEADQAANDELTTHKVLALTRLACPAANIPATTALNALDPLGGYERALARGANVVMPNLTPARYRRLYDIYPMDRGGRQGAAAFDASIRARIEAVGRRVAEGRGDSPNYLARAGRARAVAGVPEGVPK